MNRTASIGMLQYTRSTLLGVSSRGQEISFWLKPTSCMNVTMEAECAIQHASLLMLWSYDYYYFKYTKDRWRLLFGRRLHILDMYTCHRQHTKTMTLGQEKNKQMKLMIWIRHKLNTHTYTHKDSAKSFYWDPWPYTCVTLNVHTNRLWILSSSIWGGTNTILTYLMPIHIQLGTLSISLQETYVSWQ